MKRWLLDPIILILGIVSLVYFLTMTIFWQDPSPIFKEADASYAEGEKASDPVLRKKAFNRALELYTTLEKQFDVSFGTGKLYYNIAGAYYQLGEFPEAILYGYRSLSLRPRDENVLEHVRFAQKKLNLPVDKDREFFSSSLFFHSPFSIPERLQIFALFCLGAFLMGSLYLWTNHSFCRYLAFLFASIAIIALGSLGLSYYFEPVEGVIVRSSALYRDAGTQYARVKEEPVPSGLKVKILEARQRGKWLKIETPSSEVGFIPDDSISLVNNPN